MSAVPVMRAFSLSWRRRGRGEACLPDTAVYADESMRRLGFASHHLGRTGRCPGGSRVRGIAGVPTERIDLTPTGWRSIRDNP